jgi:hypothetical protein
VKIKKGEKRSNVKIDYNAFPISEWCAL